jgi:hypothetical protein
MSLPTENDSQLQFNDNGGKKQGKSVENVRNGKWDIENWEMSW